jgi:nucleoside-diphosphate-sugar epimerase
MALSHAHHSPHTPARVVVLGAGGFLGRRLLDACAAVGIATLALGSRDIDLADAAADVQLSARLRPQDALVFLAALTPDKGRDSATLLRNLAMARAICAASGTVALSHLIYVSSDAVYSFAEPLIAEETPAIPLDLYGAMHRTRELVLASEAKAPLAILRFTAVYGAGDTHNSYGPNRFLRQALKDGRIILFGNGEETRDHIYIDDAVALLLAVLRHGSTGLANLATGKSLTFRAVADLIAAKAAARSGKSVEVVPSARQNLATHRHFDVSNLVRAFPAARFTPMADGLAATLADARAGG